MDWVQNEFIKVLAWTRNKDVVSQDLGKIVSERPTLEWSAIKKELEQVFGKVVDSQKAFNLLIRIKQKQNEELFIWYNKLQFGEFSSVFLCSGRIHIDGTVFSFEFESGDLCHDSRSI
ncbi:hypothetical protein RRG08_012064 [Elysia crispata]|uniref:Uncharacterized protein n=1 Tax=Elysia crispata TaxID=231223 RepID=A0AAE1BDY1_9GAST|nr:hypothetical protein RRG08_012064 [Elysia crispata]